MLTLFKLQRRQPTCRCAWSPVAIFIMLLAIGGRLQAATIEFLSGARTEAAILSKDDKSLHVEVTISGRAIKRHYLLSTIHAVTVNDKRYVINEMPAAGTTPAATPNPAKPAQGDSPPDTTKGVRTSKADIDALINQLGRTPPDWFESTPLNYPQSLDLTWPEKPPGGGWNNQKNVGQYIWDVINPNPGKWREGVRLLHHLLTLHKDDPNTRTRAMMALGRMYHNLHEDYARAAFWWKAAGVDRPGSTQYAAMVNLAECYYRLGNRQMAVDVLTKLPATGQGIKLWADLGEMPRAIQLCDAFVNQNAPGMELALMYVADGFRQAGQLPQALAYYQRVLAVKPQGNQPQRLQKTQARAQASIDAIKLFDLAVPSRVRDGSYTSASLGYEGPVEVTVTVAAGRIEDVRVTQHREKQFYAALTDTPAKIIAKQGVKGVDATSAATITSEAIINATAKALASGAQ